MCYQSKIGREGGAMATSEEQKAYRGKRHRVEIMLEFSEYDAVKKQADLCGKPVATYCKDVILQETSGLNDYNN